VKFLYVMSHPSDRLADERAGHVVRPRQLLAGLEALGHSTAVVQAAAAPGAQGAAQSYWRLRAALPTAVALTMRDTARVVQNSRFTKSVLEQVRAARPDVLLETQVAFSSTGAVVSERTGVPLVVDDVSPVTEDEQTYDVRLRRLARARRARTLRAASLVVVTSGRLREEMVAEGIAEDRTAVLANAVPAQALVPDPAAATLRASLGFQEHDVVAAYVGSFQPFHKVQLLVRALADEAMPSQVRVLAVGDGDERSQAQALAGRLGVADRMVFTGRVPSDDVSRYMQAADLTVLPATADYTNPMKLYDYLAAGRPVVAPRQRAVQDIVGEGPVEYFEVDSVRGLVGALARLAEDSRERDRLGRAALEVASTHTWLERATALAALVDPLLERPRPGGRPLG